MIPPIAPAVEKENYNETVLIPVLQKKMNDLLAETILLQSKLEIADKERKKAEADLKGEIDSLKAELEAQRARNQHTQAESAAAD